MMGSGERRLYGKPPKGQNSQAKGPDSDRPSGERMAHR